RRACSSCFLDFLLVFSLMLGNTIPGESISFSLLSSLTDRRLVVTPASAPVGQALLEPLLRRAVSALITDDLPTFGYPMMPTEMDRLSCLLWAYDLSARKSVSEVPLTVNCLWSK